MVDLPKVGSHITISSYKHDGKHHRSWGKSIVLSASEEKIVVANVKTKVKESNGRIWYTGEPAICVFYPHRWYNIIAMFKKQGTTYYCNVASPIVLDGTVLKYIDYDLDVKLFPDDSTKILDRNEFKQHIIKYKYPEELIEVIQKQVPILEEKMHAREDIFDLEVVEELKKKWNEFKKLQTEQK